MPFGPQPARRAEPTSAHPFVVHGSPRQALARFTELQRLPRALKPEERIERDLIGGAFAEARRLLERFDAISL